LLRVARVARGARGVHLMDSNVPGDEQERGWRQVGVGAAQRKERNLISPARHIRRSFSCLLIIRAFHALAAPRRHVRRCAAVFCVHDTRTECVLSDCGVEGEGERLFSPDLKKKEESDQWSECQLIARHAQACRNWRTIVCCQL